MDALVTYFASTIIESPPSQVALHGERSYFAIDSVASGVSGSSSSVAVTVQVNGAPPPAGNTVTSASGNGVNIVVCAGSLSGEQSFKVYFLRSNST